MSLYKPRKLRHSALQYQIVGRSRKHGLGGEGIALALSPKKARKRHILNIQRPVYHNTVVKTKTGGAFQPLSRSGRHEINFSVIRIAAICIAAGLVGSGSRNCDGTG